jgi:hypothetical protein
VDAEGSVYFSGATYSDDFPVTGDAFQPARRGALDVSAVKLSADFSTLLYATYLGGNGLDAARVSHADALGNFYIAGESNSADWPTRNASQGTYGGNADAALAKFKPVR